MRFAHFPHNILKSGERRRREQAIVMEIRQTLNVKRQKGRVLYVLLLKTCGDIIYVQKSCPPKSHLFRLYNMLFDRKVKVDQPNHHYKYPDGTHPPVTATH